MVSPKLQRRKLLNHELTLAGHREVLLLCDQANRHPSEPGSGHTNASAARSLVQTACRQLLFDHLDAKWGLRKFGSAKNLSVGTT